MLTRKTTPYFPSNRDDENDLYPEGFADGKAGRKASEKLMHGRKLATYLAGYKAGKSHQPT